MNQNGVSGRGAPCVEAVPRVTAASVHAAAAAAAAAAGTSSSPPGAQVQQRTANQVCVVRVFDCENPDISFSGPSPTHAWQQVGAVYSRTKVGP